MATACARRPWRAHSSAIVAVPKRLPSSSSSDGGSRDSSSAEASMPGRLWCLSPPRETNPTSQGVTAPAGASAIGELLDALLDERAVGRVRRRLQVLLEVDHRLAA